MSSRIKKAAYATIVSLGLFGGAAGIAAAATGGHSTPKVNTVAVADNTPAADAPGADCVDGIDAVTGTECDGGPAANQANDPNEPAGAEDTGVNSLVAGTTSGTETEGTETEGTETDESDASDEVDGVDCEDGVDAATGAECDGGPAANHTD